MTILTESHAVELPVVDDTMFEAELLDALCSGRLPEADMQTMVKALTPANMTLARLTTLMQTLAEYKQDELNLDPVAFDCSSTEWVDSTRFNTYSVVSFVMAAAGVKVAKFNGGTLSENYPLLEYLGYSQQTPLSVLETLYKKVGVVYLFQSQFYPKLETFNQQWQSITRSDGVDSIFRYVSPLLNPMRPRIRLMAMSHPLMQPLLGHYLCEHVRLKKALLIRPDCSGFSKVRNQPAEMAILGKTHLYEVMGDTLQKKVLNSGFAAEHIVGDGANETLKNLTAQDNIAIFQGLTDGDDQESVYFWRVCLNAGAGLYIAGKAASISDGMVYAHDLLKQGKVKDIVAQCRKALAGTHH